MLATRQLARPNGGVGTLIWEVPEGVTVREFRFFAKNLVFSPPEPVRGVKRAQKTPKRAHFGLFSPCFRPVFRSGGGGDTIVPGHIFDPGAVWGCGNGILGTVERVPSFCGCVLSANPVFFASGRSFSG